MGEYLTSNEVREKFLKRKNKVYKVLAIIFMVWLLTSHISFRLQHTDYTETEMVFNTHWIMTFQWDKASK